MFFLFGWGRQTQKDFGPVMALECPNCKNTSLWRHFEAKTWFTLFFIPIAAYETKNVLICDVCSRGIELKGDQIEKARKLCPITASYVNKRITEEEYSRELKVIDLYGSIESSRRSKIDSNSKLPLVCPSCGKHYDESWNMCLACERHLVPVGVKC